MLKRLALAGLLCTGAAGASAADRPWVALTLGDLQAIHDTLRDNHPAPVDPSPAAAPYKRWLEQGLTKAKAMAGRVRSFEEYQRTLQFYANGFRDGHVFIGMNVDTTVQSWTGFIVGGSSADDATVISAEPDAGVKPGDRLVSCDGKNADALLAERTDPYYWNADIPHARFSQYYRLFYQSDSDPRPKPQRCTFSSGTVALNWRVIRTAELQPMLQAARGRGARDLRMQKIGEVWLISIPTFSYFTGGDIAKARAFVEALAAQAGALKSATIVLDVRGNGGGDSSWGESIAAALWGKDWVDRVARGFDNTVDWRVSRSNIAGLEINVGREKASGQSEALAYWNDALARMKAALARGEPYLRVDEPPKPVSDPPPPVPLSGHVYLFTDIACASACLDFADLVRRLPGVTQIGLPTYADALYIDNSSHALPSGLAELSYSLKVYRHRARGNNQWYEPQIRWPGGAITDQSIAAWAARLAQAR
ncbi:MAG: S41 family peptidase [Rhizomicrobium sp.]